MTKPETALSAVVERTFPLSEFGDDLHDYLQRGLRDVLYADLTALISENYTANEEVEKMVEERMKMVWEFIEWKDKKELRYSRMLNKYYDDTDSGTVELTIHDLWNYWNNIKNRQP